MVMISVHSDPAPPSVGMPIRAVRTEKRWKELLRRFASKPSAMVSLVVLATIVFFATVGPEIWVFKYDEFSFDNSSYPSWIHPFGTDNLGYDTLATVMRGTRRSLQIAVTVGVVATVVGGALGALAGYFGGIIDAVVMRTVDLFLVFPSVAVAAFLTRQVGAGSASWAVIALVLSALAWPIVARIVRSHVLVIAKADYIAAARLAGASHSRVVLRHVVPNSLGVIFAAVTVITAVAILSETALSFLGFGVVAPDTSLGLLVQGAQGAIFVRPWLFYFPGLFIFLIVLSLSFVGDGVRYAFDRRSA